jgi:hypothetical protein
MTNLERLIAALVALLVTGNTAAQGSHLTPSQPALTPPVRCAGPSPSFFRPWGLFGDFSPNERRLTRSVHHQAPWDKAVPPVLAATVPKHQGATH